MSGWSRSATARSRTSSRESASTLAISTPSTAAAARSCAWLPASWRFRTFSSSRSNFASASRFSMPSMTSPFATPSSSAARRSCDSSSRIRRRGPNPVTASSRRMLDPIDPSDTILIRPMSPVAVTCVPPQSSMLLVPASSTRTRSPYLSPKNAIAPSSRASSIEVSKWRTGSLLNTSAFARSSMRSSSSSVTGAKWAKSKRSRSGSTEDPCCLTWSPSTSRNAQCSTCVAVWLRRIAARRSTSMDAVAIWPTSTDPSTGSVVCRCSTPGTA